MFFQYFAIQSREKLKLFKCVFERKYELNELKANLIEYRKVGFEIRFSANFI